MYSITKGRGSSQNVILTNTDTMGSINLGKITIPMLDILKRDLTEELVIAEEWTLNVSAEAASELSKLAMPMKKPIRDQSKKKEEKTSVQDRVNNGEVDLFNLIYGAVE
jgi:nucleoid-associated protein YgaU